MDVQGFTKFRIWLKGQERGALLVVVLVVALGVYMSSVVTRDCLSLQVLRDRHDELGERVLAVSNRGANAPVPKHFSAVWPGQDGSSKVVADMTHYASERGVMLSSLGVQQQFMSDREVGYVRYTLALTGDYVAIKAWLQDLRVRHSSLAVENLRIQAQAGVDEKQDAGVVLILFLRD